MSANSQDESEEEENEEEDDNDEADGNGYWYNDWLNTWAEVRSIVINDHLYSFNRTCGHIYSRWKGIQMAYYILRHGRLCSRCHGQGIAEHEIHIRSNCSKCLGSGKCYCVENTWPDPSYLKLAEDNGLVEWFDLDDAFGIWAAEIIEDGLL